MVSFLSKKEQKMVVRCIKINNREKLEYKDYYGFWLTLTFYFCQNVWTAGNCITRAATPLCLRPTQHPGRLRKPLTFVGKGTCHPDCHLYILMEKRGQIHPCFSVCKV